MRTRSTLWNVGLSCILLSFAIHLQGKNTRSLMAPLLFTTIRLVRMTPPFQTMQVSLHLPMDQELTTFRLAQGYPQRVQGNLALLLSLYHETAQQFQIPQPKTNRSPYHDRRRDLTGHIGKTSTFSVKKESMYLGQSERQLQADMYYRLRACLRSSRREVQKSRLRFFQTSCGIHQK